MQRESQEMSQLSSRRHKITAAISGTACAAAALGTLYFVVHAESQPMSPPAEAPADHGCQLAIAAEGLVLGAAIAIVMGRDKAQPTDD